MSVEVIVSRDEYELLSRIARRAVLLLWALDDEIENRNVVANPLRDDLEQHRRDFGIQVPDIANVSIPRWTGEEPVRERAKAVAKSLMSIGINGPRMGAWPVEPSNIMCEGAAIIEALIAE